MIFFFLRGLQSISRFIRNRRPLRQGGTAFPSPTGFHFPPRWGKKFKYPFWRSHLAWTASTLYRSVFSAEWQTDQESLQEHWETGTQILSLNPIDRSLVTVWTFSARALSLCVRTAFSSVYNCEIREKRDRKRETSTGGLVFPLFNIKQALLIHNDLSLDSFLS